MGKLLDDIASPVDLRELRADQLDSLAEEVRRDIIDVVSSRGGHLASNLGVVELTLALHRCWDFSCDRLVWDVGHQGYAHKLLTGRREDFPSLRQEDGISGFIDDSESPYDAFNFGHTGTSLSAALGLARGDRLAGRERDVVAVIGDGALASGMPFEALFHAGSTDEDLLVVLNDNKMSISPTVGGVRRYLDRIRTSTHYNEAKEELLQLLHQIPSVGGYFDDLSRRLKEAAHAALTPGAVFVELGFNYYGPVDGHDIDELTETFRRLRRIDGPKLLHVLTEKGRGFRPASENPTDFHSSSQFTIEDGVVKVDSSGGRRYSAALGDAAVDLAEEDEDIVAITAAMPDGTGLDDFSEQFPGRFHDVGICEQHAVGLANGLAAAGKRPLVAIYSTFLQRAYDQLFHDLALQEAPVTVCVDRAGLVGNDGPTHHGLYDIACMRTLPEFVLMAPRDEAELRAMLALSLDIDGPSAIRYPRESVPAAGDRTEPELELGRAEVVREGSDAAIIAYGALVERAVRAADILQNEQDMETEVVNARFARPLDAETICGTVSAHETVVVAEDHCRSGGFGSAVLELLVDEGVDTSGVELAGVPPEKVEQAERDTQLGWCGLDARGLVERLSRVPAPA